MNRSSILVLILCSLFSVVKNSYAQTEFLVTIDRTIGEHFIIDALPTVNFIHVEATTYDQNNKRYIFRGIDFDGNDRLFCINSITGATISEPLFPENVGQLHYDNSNDVLYGLKIEGGIMYLVSIDIPTATTTTIVDLPILGFMLGSTYFDEANQNYVQLMGGSFYKTNVITGDIEITPASENFNALQYDNTNEKLYGLFTDGITRLVSIDTDDGTYSTIADMPELGHVVSIPCFDEINQYYTYASPSFLLTVDVLTGDILWDPIFPNIEPGENVIECHYDNESGILYALHWGSPDPEIEDPPADSAFVLNDTICSGEMATLTVSEPGEYNWVAESDPGVVLGSGETINVSPTSTTTYYALEDDDTLVGTVVVYEITADFTFTPETPFVGDEIFFLDGSTDAETWDWSFGSGAISTDQNPIYSYDEEGTYVVVLVVSNAFCNASYSITLTVNDTTSEETTDVVEDPVEDPIEEVDEELSPPTIEDPLFFVPNAFTPNSGQLNAVFLPVFTSGYDPYDYHLTIFSREGEIVFESYDATVGWDGTYGANNGIVQDGVYIWRIDFSPIDTDQKFVKIGHVVLIR